MNRIHVVVLLSIIFVLADFAQSYNGRRELVQAERVQCRHASQVRIQLANTVRADEQANAIIANDPQQPVRTRLARHREVAAERITLDALDRLIDRRDLQKLNDVGHELVLSLGKNAYDCDKAYPPASPFRFFG